MSTVGGAEKKGHSSDGANVKRRKVSGTMKNYCMKCKDKTPVEMSEWVKDGTRAAYILGKCTKCGMRVSRTVGEKLPDGITFADGRSGGCGCPYAAPSTAATSGAAAESEMAAAAIAPAQKHGSRKSRKSKGSRKSHGSRKSASKSRGSRKSSRGSRKGAGKSRGSRKSSRGSRKGARKSRGSRKSRK